MEEQTLIRTAEQLIPKERQDFLFPPPLDVEVAELAPSFAGGLVGRRILLNQRFIQQMAESRDIPSQVIVQAVIDRSLNRWMRIPQSFGQALKLYAALRDVVLDEKTARKHLEIYLALWNELDLHENRGKGETLIELYRASLAIPKEEQRKLPHHYLILVSVLQKKWGQELGLDPELLAGWEPLAEKLAQIDYLYGSDRERDIQDFGKLYARCYYLVEQMVGKQDEQQEPVHWPLENTLDSFLAARDIAEGIAQFLEEFGEEALKLLEEFSALSPEVRQLLGQTALLEQSRWYWYEFLAQQYRIAIEKRPSEETGRVYYVNLTEWHPGDGTQHIAPLATFGPIGFPHITKRWLHSGPESHYSDRQVPDLIIVIDSSGSMPNADSQKSFAVLGGFVAANSYLDYGNKVAVVNFSSNDLVLDFTTDRTPIYKYLAAFQGGGTQLNPETIDKLLEKSRGEVDLLLITDMGLSSFEETLQKFAKHAQAHRVFVMLINADLETEKEARAKLPESVEFFRIEKDEDIPNIVLGAVQRSFGIQKQEEG